MTKLISQKAIGIVLIIGLTACSTFHRASEAPEPQPAATPLDVPKEPQASATPGEAPHQVVEGAMSSPAPAPANEGPTVTLVKKDGTPVENHEPVAAKDVAPHIASAPPTQDAAVASGSDWDYSGSTGPEHWADLKSEYSACRDGKEQSPIDLKWHKPVKGGQVAVKYKTSKAHVSTEHHTIKLDFESGNVIKIDGKTYDLVSALFHAGSEHTLSGKTFPLEMHLVHKDSSGKLGVLSVLFKEGKENPTISKILNTVPSSPSSETGAEVALQTQSLVPAMHTHYQYEGSLTTPPCTEGVEWVVFNSPLSVSSEQMKTFEKYISANSRPTQPLNGRKVVNY